MKFKEIEFKDKNSNRIYQDYVSRVQNAIKVLDKKSRQEILLEINSHIYEGMMYDSENQKGEVEKLLNILEKLGQPEVFLKPLVAEKKLEEATKSFNPVKIAKALALNIGNGISYVIFSILYLFLSTFILLIIAKFVSPENVGFFYYPDETFMFGYNSSVKPHDYQYERLGNWFIPAMLLSAVISYLFITLSLRLKRTLKNKLS